LVTNKKGHEAGDEMLRSVAEALAAEFERNSIYRIGGDEFVLLLTDASYPELCHKMQSVRSCLSQKSYHIAAGIALADMEDKISMTELVQQADFRMRKDKDLYYQQSGMRNARK
jgi:diguanylate cyclase (GGDEF)-like protein